MKINKKLFVIISFAILLILSFCIYGIYTYINFYQYDNDTPISQIKNQQYSEDEIEQLEYDALTNSITYKEFLRQYKPQLIRKTFKGSYALFKYNNLMYFVFWEANTDIIYTFYKTDGFVTHDIFEKSVEIGKTSYKDIVNSRMNVFCYPYSSRMLTGHICSDGFLIVQYDSNLIAKSIKFYDNEELINTEDAWLQLAPYILPQDKQIMR